VTQWWPKVPLSTLKAVQSHWIRDRGYQLEPGVTPVHLAATVDRGTADVVQALLAAGTDPSLGNQVAVPLLHAAIWAGPTAMVTTLLAAEVAPDVRDDEELPPAACCGYRFGRLSPVSRNIVSSRGQQQDPYPQRARHFCNWPSATRGRTRWNSS